MNKTLINRTAKAMLVAGFAVALSPLSASANGEMVNADMQAVNQQNQIKGTVVDELGEPMIGVTVKVKGSQAAAITDIDGNFTVNAAANATLEFSYVGYLTQTVTGAAAKNVKMKPDSQMMEEVVVIGYGTVKKRDMLGAISQVKSEDIKQAPTSNAMEGLQGKISGLDITRTSGAAGEDPEILLRGSRSIDGSNAPLYVIDGVSGGSISNLNPNDIESIEVLKDASSTAIYGSAGANGVIIVTTKQGTKGKVSVDFNAYVGLNCMPAYPETYQGNDWIDYMASGYEAYYGQSVWNKYSTRDEAMNRLFSEFGISQAGQDCYNQGKFINWKDEILQTGVQQNYNVSVRGGTDKLTGYMSAGYQDEKGMYRNDEYQQITFRAGATYQINKIISTGFQSTLTYKDRDRRNSRLSKTLNEVPLGTVYHEDGSLNWYPTDPTGVTRDYVNIMADDIPGQYKNNSKSTNINIAPFVEIKPFKGFSFKSLFNAGVSTSRAGTFEGLNTYYKLTGSSQDVGIRTASKSHSDSWSIQWQNVMNYNFTIKDIHDFTLTAIMEWNKGTSEYTYAYNRGFDYDSYEWDALAYGLQPQVNSTWSQTKKLSYAGRVNYSLLGRYLLSATVRWDGASQLYKKWDSFPSASFGWRVSDEAFMESTKSWLDNLKVRVGYGVTGNSNIPAYSSLTLVQSSANNLNLGGGQVQSYILTQSVANYGLTWEKSYNWNVGLDFGFLNGRIDGSLEWYTTDTKGVLYKRQLPTAYGLYNAKSPYTMMSNVARIKNNGFEATINTRNIVSRKSGGFNWNSTITFATNSEKLKEIDLGNNTTVDELVSLGLFIDNPVNTYYGYKKVGIWQSGEEDQAACFGLQPGQVHLDAPGLVWDPNYTYEGYTTNRETSEKTAVTRHGAFYNPSEDNEDGTHNYYTQTNQYSVSAKDKQILGHKNPKFTIGFLNNFTYKGFDLAIQAVMRWGQMCKGDMLGYVNAKNQPSTFDYWTPTNATNAFPLAKLGVSNEAKEALTYVDGSFIKIKNITLGYTLPRNVLKSVNMSKFRIYATIQNPFIFAKDDMLKGLDPENTSSEFPLYKTIVFGINASF